MNEEVETSNNSQATSAEASVPVVPGHFPSIAQTQQAAPNAYVNTPPPVYRANLPASKTNRANAVGPLGFALGVQQPLSHCSGNTMGVAVAPVSFVPAGPLPSTSKQLRFLNTETPSTYTVLPLYKT